MAGNRGDARSWLELFRVRYAQEAVGLEWWREYGKTEWTIQLPIVDVAQLGELDLALIEQDDCPTVRVGLFGLSGVGKTALATRLVKKHFVEEHDPDDEETHIYNLMVGFRSAALHIMAPP